ncbi:VanZ family protein [Flavobacterium kingsejongi]|uniref:VanZ family protein n=1 Tax=Flavobacterium kingsejongi TaxID=1678728 RepID=UPI0013009D7F|nr:VanZ family protein [Flavobacterium kingsejongi]
MHKNILLGAAILWTVAITILSLVTLKVSDGGISNADKYVHFTFYFVFTTAWFLFLRSTSPKARIVKNIIVCFFLAVAYGALMEVLQGLLTVNRSADIMDALANTTGSLAASLILYRMYHNK